MRPFVWPPGPVPVKEPADAVPNLPTRRTLFTAGSALLAATAIPAAGLAINPDADLIALCDRHIANIRAFNERADESDDAPEAREYDRTRDLVDSRRATTIQGAIARARVIHFQFMDGDPEDPAGAMDSDWAWSVIDDLVRTHGGAA